VRSNRLFAIALGALLAAWPLAAAPSLQYVVIVSRHGVRAPTWEPARLNEYSAQPWPQWGVAPGELTPHGRELIELMGAYDRQWLIAEHLLSSQGCRDAERIRIVADTSQRTLETGRAFARSLLPGCAIAVQSQPDGRKDPLFSGFGTADPDLSLSAIRARMGADPRKLLDEHQQAVDLLQSILSGGERTARKLLEPPAMIAASLNGKTVELTGPFAVGSTLSESLLLEYANGFPRANLGWGRLTRDSLFQVLELHAVYADVMRRTAYVARARGSNLLQHVLLSLQQAASGKPVAGALGRPGDVLLILSGHDTNLSNLSGMLGLSWKLPGYQPDDTPPGGALIFSLWHGDPGESSVTLQYVAQSLDQMRNREQLTLRTPPLRQAVSIPGCQAAAPNSGCSWASFQEVLQKATDPAFVAASADGHRP
jgi:4-phytase/acid phosphatase